MVLIASASIAAGKIRPYFPGSQGKTAIRITTTTKLASNKRILQPTAVELGQIMAAPTLPIAPAPAKQKLNMTYLKQLDPAEYANYFKTYVNNVRPEMSMTEALEHSRDELMTLYRSCSPEQLTTPYAPGKWTLKQILQHLIDSERVFNYRALRFARADETELLGFEQDDYVAAAPDRPLEELLTEYEVVRRATILLFASFSTEALLRHGTASGNTLSVRSLAFLIAGHDTHHLRIIRERYL